MKSITYFCKSSRDIRHHSYDSPRISSLSSRDFCNKASVEDNDSLSCCILISPTRKQKTIIIKIPTITHQQPSVLFEQP